MELETLSASSDDLRAQGADVVFISPQLPEQSRDFVQEKKLSVDILSDPGNEVAAKFGLKFQLPDYLKTVYLNFGIDLEKSNGDNSWTLPMSARYIIDQKGIVRYADVNTDYTIRPEAEETLEALKQI
ncbi:MAG: redoxin domain-containing protein [Desulfobacteraceae bacterium]|nr:redoxin domain-containing protein [Desulfobacteraceae bacterium]